MGLVFKYSETSYTKNLKTWIDIEWYDSAFCLYTKAGCNKFATEKLCLVYVAYEF